MIFGEPVPDGEMLSGKPYVGMGFNIWNSEQEGGDISGWEGFCLEYQASMSFRMRLKSESDGSSSYENNLETEISRSDSMVVVDIPWSGFKFESWGPGTTKEEILAKTAAVHLLFSGDSGETGEFKLVKFGSLGGLQRNGFPSEGSGPIPFENTSNRLSPIYGRRSYASNGLSAFRYKRRFLTAGNFEGWRKPPSPAVSRGFKTGRTKPAVEIIRYRKTVGLKFPTFTGSAKSICSSLV